MENKITPERINEIAEELRRTRYKDTNKLAIDYIYKKYKNEFASYDMYLKCMQICALFFASRGEQTQKDRDNTKFIFITK